MKPFTVLRSETQGDFDVLLAALRDEFQPATEHQRFLVEQMAAARWRLARLQQMETAVFDALMNPDAPRSIADQVAVKFGSGAATNLAAVNRLITAAERSYFKAHAELARARQNRKEAATVDTLDQAVLTRLATAPPPRVPASQIRPAAPAPRAFVMAAASASASAATRDNNPALRL